MTKKKPNPHRDKLIAEAKAIVAKRGHKDPGPDECLTPQEALAEGMSLREYVEYLDSFLEPVCAGLGITKEEFRRLDSRAEQLLAFLVYDGRLSNRKAALVYLDYRLSGSKASLKAFLPEGVYIARHDEPTSRDADWGTYFLTNQKPTEETNGEDLT
jgi:hypothetical protein